MQAWQAFGLLFAQLASNSPTSLLSCQSRPHDRVGFVVLLFEARTIVALSCPKAGAHFVVILCEERVLAAQNSS